MRFLSKTSLLGAQHLSLLFILLFTFCALSATAQYSNLGFSFQGYAIDGEGKALASKGVTVRFTVYRTGVSYVEEHALTTDAYGVFVANVGKGTTSSTPTFPQLDFNNFDFSLRVEVRETIGGTYATISDKALQAVPYARSASNGVPVGTIVAFAGPDTNIPEGWLLCNGGNGVALNATANPQYAQLFAAIGTTWGGTGVSNFFVPDLRGMFLRGLNKETTGTDANRVLGTQQAGEIQSHNHAASAANEDQHRHNYWDIFWSEASSVGTTKGVTTFTSVPSNWGATGGDGDNEGWNISRNSEPGSAHTHAITVNLAGGTETRPINKAVNYIIKY